MPGKGGDFLILVIIEKKKQGKELTKNEIKYFVENYVDGEIPDYQISALLMAIYFRGLSDREIFDLTDVMLHTGDVLDFSDLGTIVDKHSTGGVGDKVTLIAAPLMAAGGLKVAKMSGRGLGHTGGTIDKLEAVPGFCTALSPNRFRNQVKEIGLAISGQTETMVPADKKLYALRDMTGTVDSIPLIAASILAKKLALSPAVIVFDVKFGSGAFMKTQEEAENLAAVMNEIAGKAGAKTAAFLSRMDAPLGRAIGNGLEVAEAYRALAGQPVPGELMESALLIAGCAFHLAGKAEDLAVGYKMAADLLASGAGLEKFFAFLAAQGGGFDRGDFPASLPKAKEERTVVAASSGYVCEVNGLEIAVCSQLLGAGRQFIGAGVDSSAGIYLHKVIGEKVEAGEKLATLYGTTSHDDLATRVKAAFSIGSEAVNRSPHVTGIVTGQSYRELTFLWHNGEKRQ